jgi:hypothetical protein
MAKETYLTSKPIAGDIKTAKVTAGIETYKIGTVLERPATTYIPWAGTNPIKGIAWQGKVIASPELLVVATTGSEVLGEGLFDAAGDALTITAAIVENARDSGIIIR